MKSTLRVALDQNNQPIIQVKLDYKSEDLRDQVLLKFKERLGYTSNYSRIEFQEQEDGKMVFNIIPITPEGLMNVAKEAMYIAKKAESPSPLDNVVVTTYPPQINASIPGKYVIQTPIEPPSVTYEGKLQNPDPATL